VTGRRSTWQDAFDQRYAGHALERGDDGLAPGGGRIVHRFGYPDDDVVLGYGCAAIWKGLKDLRREGVEDMRLAAGVGKTSESVTDGLDRKQVGPYPAPRRGALRWTHAPARREAGISLQASSGVGRQCFTRA
jgi:hypothetical protein